MGLKKPDVKVEEVEEIPQEEAEAPPETAKAETKTKPKTKPAEVEPDAQPDVQPAAKPLAVVGGTEVMTKGGKFEDHMAEQGFEGLEVGFYSYTTIKLATEGRFETADGVELGKSLKLQLMESKRKFVYGSTEDENVAEFSYDRVHNTKGEALAPKFKEWEDEGGKVVEKKYLDVTAAVLEGELEGEIVILSVSPSGVAKFTGYVGKLNYAKLNLREVVTECFVGPKVTGVAKPFYPWAFRLVK